MLEFSSLLMDAPDIHRFPSVHMVKTLNIVKSGKMRKYNYAALFLSQICWLFVFHIFS